MKHLFGDRSGIGSASATLVYRWRGLRLHDLWAEFTTYCAFLFQQEVDARRPFLFLAPALMIGVLLYFAADDEPSLYAPLIAFIPVSGLIIYGMTRPTRSVSFTGLALAAVLAGFTGSTWRSQRVDAPIITETVIAPIKGFVQSIDVRSDGARLLIKPVESGSKKDGLPLLLRVTMAGTPQFEAGASIRAMARLMPPPGPVRPGGYDFARDAYFNQIGGVGSLVGQITILSNSSSVSCLFDLTAMIDRFRNHLAARIYTIIGGQAGAVAAALMTGKRGMISDETNDDLRAAGVYHVVSISGLHMVLAAGMIFYIVRLCLVLIPGLALNVPIKSYAAFIAMIGATAYDIFAGSEVATERSLLMTLALFGAILIGRPALSMRMLAFAAVIIIMKEPESILGPSFQMSFAAVAALVAAFEKSNLAKYRWDQDGGSIKGRISNDRHNFIEQGLHHVFRHAKAIILTTIIAEIATAPFAIYHFQRFQPLGLIGNMFTIPLVEMLAMPFGFIGLLALPFGLDAYFWHVMGFGVAAMLALAHYVAAFPYSSLVIATIPPESLLFICAGMMWIYLWSTVLRWAGCILIVIGTIFAFNTVHPDVFIARDGMALAARGRDGSLHMIGRSLPDFTVMQWLAADGDNRRSADPSLKEGVYCTMSGCIFKADHNQTIILGLAHNDLDDDCHTADLLVSPFFAPSICADRFVIDRALLAQHGALALYVEPILPDHQYPSRLYRIEGARDPQHSRPWTQRHETAAALFPAVARPSAQPPDPENETLSPR